MQILSRRGIAACLLGLTAGVGSAIMVRRSADGPPEPPDRQVLKPLNPRFSDRLMSMYRNQPQRGQDGQLHPIDGVTRVGASEGMMLYSLCRRMHAQNTMEVGLAYGYSTMFFMAAAAENGGNHIAIDPFEFKDFQGIGVENIKQVGMEDHFRIVQDLSVHALPLLETEGRKFEVIFIDGSHHYEDALLDFVLSDRVCAPGGYIVMDDMWLPAVRKVVTYVAKNRPDYAQRKSDVHNAAVFQKIGDDKRDFRDFVNF